MRLGVGEILVVLGLGVAFFGPSKLPALEPAWVRRSAASSAASPARIRSRKGRRSSRRAANESRAPWESTARAGE